LYFQSIQDTEIKKRQQRNVVFQSIEAPPSGNIMQQMYLCGTDTGIGFHWYKLGCKTWKTAPNEMTVFGPGKSIGIDVCGHQKTISKISLDSHRISPNIRQPRILGDPLLSNEKIRKKKKSFFFFFAKLNI
jgi:hypothetical protein